MAEKIKNIGLFYQKQYFKGIVYDENDANKNVAEQAIINRNNLLLRNHIIENQEYHSSTAENSFKLKTQYPGLVTGIGMKHETSIKGELKLGMYFDYTCGMPCIPASSVKGALRSAFPQFDKHKKTDDKHKKTDDKIKKAKAFILNQMLAELKVDGFVPLAKLEDMMDEQYKKIKDIEEEIFDGKNKDPENKDKNGVMKSHLSIYEKDIFHDAFIVNGDSKGRILADDAITHHPHPLKNPNPVLFLKIPSGICIKFNFDLKQGTILKAKEKLDLFKEIILYYGIGAKTNVGYGQFETAKKV
jgi:CRISPR-associated protein Cmr6